MAQGILLDEADFLKEIVERVLQEVLEAEITEHLGAAAPHERTETRKGHRNGHKPRTLRTRVGTLSLLVLAPVAPAFGLGGGLRLPGMVHRRAPGVERAVPRTPLPRASARGSYPASASRSISSVGQLFRPSGVA